MLMLMLLLPFCHMLPRAMLYGRRAERRAAVAAAAGYSMLRDAAAFVFALRCLMPCLFMLRYAASLRLRYMFQRGFIF